MNTSSVALRILVVEDNLINQQVAKGILSHMGHRVSVANDGQDALDMLLPGAFDVIFMDVQMPVVDGVEATLRIRAMSAPLKDIPIIAMTASDDPRDTRRCLEAGMNDSIGKPFDLNYLNGLLTRIIEQLPVSTPSSEAAPEPTPPLPEVLDQTVLNETLMVLGGEAYQELCDMLFEGLDEAYQELDQLLPCGNWGAIRKLYHAQKGGAANLGMPRLTYLLGQEEIAARELAALGGNAMAITQRQQGLSILRNVTDETRSAIYALCAQV